MAFVEVQFPPQVQYSSSGGPMWRTEIVELNGGQEQRNLIWTDARHRYQISEFQTDSDIDTIIRFFHAMPTGLCPKHQVRHDRTRRTDRC